MRHTRLSNEPADYLAQRETLRQAEIELMRNRERVAELRRHLPPGAPMQDYAFQEGPSDLTAGDGPIRTVRLSELLRADSVNFCALIMSSKRRSRLAKLTNVTSRNLLRKLLTNLWRKCRTLRSS